jgi:hypothetical protein
MVQSSTLEEKLVTGLAQTGEELESWEYKEDKLTKRLFVAVRSKGWTRGNTVSALSETLGLPREAFRMNCIRSATICMQGKVVVF